MNFSLINSSISISPIFAMSQNDVLSLDDQLQAAAKAGNFAEVRKLVSEGANPNLEIVLSEDEALQMFKESSFILRGKQQTLKLFSAGVNAFIEKDVAAPLDQDAHRVIEKIVDPILFELFTALTLHEFVDYVPPPEGADFENQVGYVSLPLILLAAMQDDDESTTHLLENGAIDLITGNVDEPGYFQFLAAFNLPRAAAHCILKKGILPNQGADEYDTTPFEFALLSNNIEVMRVFLTLAPECAHFENILDDEVGYLASVEDPEAQEYGFNASIFFEAYKPMIELFKEMNISLPDELNELLEKYGYA